MEIRTVVFGKGGNRDLRMHLLLPEKGPTPAPAIVWVFGGGWMRGSKDTGIPRLFPFVRRGYVGAACDYRLTDETRWPAQIEDVKCAVRYLRAHADELGLDPHRIGAWGPSAGGHLVAMLGVAPDRPELEGRGGWADQSSRVQAVCDWFGPSDFTTMVDQPSDVDRSGSDYPEARLIGGRIQDNPEKARAASPTAPFYVTGREPPFLIVHGDADRTVPYQQSEALYSGIGLADVTFTTVHGAPHGGPLFEHQALLDKVAAFFDRTIGPAPLPAPVDLRPRVVAEPPRMTTIASRGWGAEHTAPPLTSWRSFESKAAGGPVGYAVYLPPRYDADASKQYPTIYWLHGRGGDPRRATTFVRMFDEAVGKGIAPPAIVVVPNGGPCGWYCDWPSGEWPIETVLIQELIPHVDATYRTIANREARVVEGQSMGGFGAGHLGFKYPELFGAVSLSAAALIDFAANGGATLNKVWGGDAATFRAEDPFTLVRQNADRIRGRQLIRLFCGDQDRLLEGSQRMHELLDKLRIENELEVVPGAVHSYESKLERLGLNHFSWFARALGALV
jgi:acetyl esterase/lipase